MNIKKQIDLELKEIVMSEAVKSSVRQGAEKRRIPRYLRIAVVSLAILLLGGITCYAGYYIKNKIMVNEQVLPELDPMYAVSANALNLPADEYGRIFETVEEYETIQTELGLDLLDSDLAENNPYMLGEIETDNEDYATITMKNYILGDTANYQYLPEEGYYTYDRGEEYVAPVSLTVDIMLSEAQMENGWSRDYLGLYEFKESYVSAQGYKVNIVEDTMAEGIEDVVSEKCMIFVADGIRYTLKGRTSLENMKQIVDSMQ